MKGAAVAFVAIAAFLLLRSSGARAMTDTATMDTNEIVPPDVLQNAETVPTINIWDDNTMIDGLNRVPDQNVAAFLRMIRCCEHRYPDNVVNDVCYQIFYGGGKFFYLSDHPVNTGEKQKVLFTPDQCAKYGYEAGKGWGSTAAGAYQIIKPTWDMIRAIEPRLSDFSPEAQDQAAIRLLAQCGALADVQNNNLTAAIAKASKIWASLPGSTANQNPKQMQFALDRFYEVTA